MAGSSGGELGSLGPAARRPHLSRLSTSSTCRHDIPLCGTDGRSGRLGGRPSRRISRSGCGPAAVAECVRNARPPSSLSPTRRSAVATRAEGSGGAGRAYLCRSRVLRHLRAGKDSGRFCAPGHVLPGDGVRGHVEPCGSCRAGRCSWRAGTGAGGQCRSRGAGWAWLAVVPRGRCRSLVRCSIAGCLLAGLSATEGTDRRLCGSSQREGFAKC